MDVNMCNTIWTGGNHRDEQKFQVAFASPSPAVVDQAVRELCRYVNAGDSLDVSRGLIELQSALNSCDLDFVTVIVKGVGFLCRVAFRNDPSWGRKYSHSPEFHPFIKVLSYRAELASEELTQQVLLFIVHNIRAGIPAVSEFIRPFLMFCILKIPSSAHMSLFTKNLISSIVIVLLFPRGSNSHYQASFSLTEMNRNSNIFSAVLNILWMLLLWS